MSFGVAASDSGDQFDFSRLFGQADRALYEAKRAGGNRVRMWPLAGPDTAASNGHNGALGAEAARQFEHLEREFDRREAASADAPSDGAHHNHDLESGDERGDPWEHWNAREHAATGNWLVRDDVQRRQLLELNRALREKAKGAFLLGFALGGVSAIQYGWQIMLAPAVMAAIYVLVEHHIERFRHPEYALGLGWIGLQTSFLISGLLANSAMVFAFPLLLVLLIGSSAVFPPRGVIVGVVLTVFITIAVGVAEAPALMGEAPGILAFYLVLVVSIGALGTTIGRSTIEYRDLGIVDQLTGLFNRGALVSRVAELTHRSASESSPVALVVADVDRFKAINDSYGHATGDAVLREIGYRVRKNLRAFESAYRIGGEEFVILLDEVDWQHAEQVALRLREAIGETPIAGRPHHRLLWARGDKAGRGVRLRLALQVGRCRALCCQARGRRQRLRGRGRGAQRPAAEPHGAPVQLGLAGAPPVQTERLITANSLAARVISNWHDCRYDRCPWRCRACGQRDARRGRWAAPRAASVHASFLGRERSAGIASGELPRGVEKAHADGRSSATRAPSRTSSTSPTRSGSHGPGYLACSRPMTSRRCLRCETNSAG